MINAILNSFLLSVILIVWFQTNAFVEYFSFLSIVKKYHTAQNAGLNTLFINFLAINYNSFLIRLITCPYCLNFWMSLIFSLFIGWKFFGFLYILSMLYYKIILVLSKYESR